MNLIEELCLVRRMVYTVGLVWIVTSVTHFGTPTTLMNEGVLVMVFSFVWQYYVLHHVLHNALSKNGRVVTLFMWMTIALVLGTWGVYALANIDVLQDEASFRSDFVQKMAIYLVASSMFVSGTCAARAFARHKAL